MAVIQNKIGSTQMRYARPHLVITQELEGIVFFILNDYNHIKKCKLNLYIFRMKFIRNKLTGTTL